MATKEVVVHLSVIEAWAKRDDPPRPKDEILVCLKHIQGVQAVSDPADFIVVEESATSGFASLLQKVGQGNEVNLMGARDGACLKVARGTLEKAGIKVKLDPKGSLP